MRQIRELLHLHFEQGLSHRLMMRSLGIGRSTVERGLKRFAQSGLTWPLDPALTDAELERRLYLGPAHRGTALTCVRPAHRHAVVLYARSVSVEGAKLPFSIVCVISYVPYVSMEGSNWA